ncbi:MAG: hypothetical protein NC127_02355 [Muribaculum sp.]|nr:hypothetical protein [Muribaculum sp.]
MSDEYKNLGPDRRDEVKKNGGTPQTVRNIFGVFMILIYVGMGVLFLIDFFGWSEASWGWLRYVVGIALIVYGLWRGYRQFAGIDRNIGDQY